MYPPDENKILDGDLQTLGLHATLKMLALGNKTGQLNVVTMGDHSEGGTARQSLSIYLRKGSIVALESTPPPQINLLDMLRLLRSIHRHDAQEIHELTGDQLFLVLNELVSRGLMSATEQQQRIEFLIIQEIARGLRWERGTFEFLSVEVMNTAITPMNVDHILLEAIRQVDELKALHLPIHRDNMVHWREEFNGDISAISTSFSIDDIKILSLCSGQHSIAHIAFMLMQPEVRIAQRIQVLIEWGLVEQVDIHYEQQLEQSLQTVITISQNMLMNDARQMAENRLLVILEVMGTCINKLLSHHGRFARNLYGRNATRMETIRVLDALFMPLLRQAQNQFPITESVAFMEGQLDYSDLLLLRHQVRGQDFDHYSWEAAQAFQWLMRETFRGIIEDAFGTHRANRRVVELWETFVQEIAGEMERQSARRNAMPRRGGQ